MVGVNALNLRVLHSDPERNHWQQRHQKYTHLIDQPEKEYQGKFQEVCCRGHVRLTKILVEQWGKLLINQWRVEGTLAQPNKRKNNLGHGTRFSWGMFFSTVTCSFPFSYFFFRKIYWNFISLTNEDWLEEIKPIRGTGQNMVRVRSDFV